MMVSKRYPRLLSLLVLACIAYEGDSPSKFRVSTPALLYKVLPQSYQESRMVNIYV